MEDQWQDEHANDDHHEAWTPGDECWHPALVDEQGQELPF